METNLPKNFPFPLKKSYSAPSNQPEVTREEIANFLVQRLLQAREPPSGTGGRPRIYIVEFPFPNFEINFALALRTYPNNPACRKAMMPEAKCSKAV